MKISARPAAVLGARNLFRSAGGRTEVRAPEGLRRSHSEGAGEKLIVFVKAPRPGTVKTRLAEAIGAESACAAYRRIVATLLSQLQSLNAVELCFTPDDAADQVRGWLKDGWNSSPQAQGDLGQRLQSAFARAFDTGAKRVVVIGSDCPAVTDKDILEAWEILRTADVALGPATDGGYWLIGLREVHPELFRGIPWSTEKVFAQTLERIRRSGLRVQLLRELTDVDTEGDWRHFVASRNQVE